MTDEPQSIWLARHGRRIDFADPSWARTAERPYDPHLTERGLEQARALGLRLAGEGVRRIFASPFLRTVQTASAVAERIEAPICIEHGAGEWLKADWFSAPPTFPTPREMARRFPRVDPGYRSLVEPDFPESWRQHLQRGAQAARALTDRFEQDFLVVGHAAGIISMVRGLLGNGRVEVGTAECSLTMLVRRQGGWRLQLNGDTSHLHDPGPPSAPR